MKGKVVYYSYVASRRKKNTILLRVEPYNCPHSDTNKNADDNGGVDEGGVASSSRTVKDDLVLVRNLQFVYPFLLSELVVE